MRTLLTVAVIASGLAGCAVAPEDPLIWMPGSGSTMLPHQAEAKCDYETSAATQAGGYGFTTSLGRELDRALRKQELYTKCMRANGFFQQKASSIISQPADPKWAALESDLEMAKSHRANVRARLTAGSSPAQAASLSDEIKSLNIEVAELEKKLSYAPTPPVNSNP